MRSALQITVAAALGVGTFCIAISLGSAHSRVYASALLPRAAVPTKLLEQPPSSTSIPSLAPRQITASPRSAQGLTSVKPAAPNGIAVSGTDINTSVAVVQRTAEGIGPPEATLGELQAAYWWSERAEPGSSSAGTTFIAAHSCRKVHCAFNELPRAVVGAQVTIITPHGVLIYRVFRTASYPKQGPYATQYQPDVFRDVKNQLVLVTCKLRTDGQRATDNFVVWASLVSASPA